MAMVLYQWLGVNDIVSMVLYQRYYRSNGIADTKRYLPGNGIIWGALLESSIPWCRNPNSLQVRYRTPDHKRLPNSCLFCRLLSSTPSLPSLVRVFVTLKIIPVSQPSTFIRPYCPPNTVNTRGHKVT